jgi:hypothetical protein
MPRSTHIPRCIATKKTHRLLHRTPTASTADVFNGNLRLERLCDANATAEGDCAASRRWCNQSKNTRENDHANARQTNTHRSQRDGHAHPQLRWVGLEEKAEQLEKELEQSALTDWVVPIQNETD